MKENKTMKKTFIFLVVLTFVFGPFAFFVNAIKPSDFGLKEGDVISAEGDPDVYIVNDYGYKRLFVNPEIFNLYGHLGWDKIKKVSSVTRDAFITSGLFRNCETDDQKVYGLDVLNEDVANLRWVNTTGAQAVSDDPDFFKKVFCINSKEFNLYRSGPSFSSVLDIPKYFRDGSSLASICGSISPKSSGAINGDVVFCDSHNRLWTPTLSREYNWEDALKKCEDLTYAVGLIGNCLPVTVRNWIRIVCFINSE